MKEFFAAIKALIQAWEEYTTEGSNEPFWKAVDKLRDAMPEKPMSRKNFRVHIAAMKFFDEVQMYDDRELIRMGEHPHDEFWSALTILSETGPDKEPPYPGSVETLLKQGVGQPQICTIWGFVDSEGRIDTATYEAEIAEPGSQTKDRPWAALMKHRKAIEKDFAQYTRSMKSKKEAEVDDGEPCPEPPEELYRQNVGVAQAALMLKVSQEAVETLYAGFEAQGIKRHDEVEATQKDGEPMTEYVPTEYVPVDTSRPLSADELAESEYAALDLEQLTELCEAAGLSIDGDTDDLRARLAAHDSAAEVA